MKTEINLETKAKFFAQYACQGLLGTRRGGKDLFIIGDWRIFNEDYLLLKPLSSITDEDARHSGITKGRLKQHVQYHHIMTPFMCDYLRSKGYALPWMGLSVEEMVQAGWIKLIF